MSADRLNINMRYGLTLCVALFVAGLLLAGSMDRLGHTAEKLWMQVKGGLK